MVEGGTGEDHGQLAGVVGVVAPVAGVGVEGVVPPWESDQPNAC